MINQTQNELRKAPQKPILKKITPGIYLFTFIVFLIVLLILLSATNPRENKAEYQNEIAEKKRIQYIAENEQYLTDTISMIESVSPKYQFSDSSKASIPVYVSVLCKRAADAEYIGSEMSYSFRINGKRVTTGEQTINYSLSANTIETKITENDPVSDDVGTVSETIVRSFPEINDGLSIVHDVEIYEFYGNDAGNKDHYFVTYSIIPVSQISLPSSLKESFPRCPTIPSDKKTNYNEFLAIWRYICHYPAPLIIFVILLSATGFIIFRIRSRYNKEYRQSMSIYTKYENEKEALIKELNGHSLEEYAHVPAGIQFDDSDLPYTNSVGKYGIFTAYVSLTGNCYHTKKQCGSSDNRFIFNIVEILPKWRPCKRCSEYAIKEIPQWYKDYKEIKEKCKYYNIPIDTEDIK